MSEPQFALEVRPDNAEDWNHRHKSTTTVDQYSTGGSVQGFADQTRGH